MGRRKRIVLEVVDFGFETDPSKRRPSKPLETPAEMSAREWFRGIRESSSNDHSR